MQNHFWVRFFAVPQANTFNTSGLKPLAAVSGSRGRSQAS